MTRLITDAVAVRLRAGGAVARPQDLYSGSGADFYERLVGADRAEVREVLALARQSDGPILDIAAGSGRLTIPLVRSGARVTAIDLSKDMLDHLRRAVPDDSGLTCVLADMCDFTLPDRYGLAILGATSITLLDREGRARLYERVRHHLVRGGVFALTVAAGASARSLTVSTDQEVIVPRSGGLGSDGDDVYLFSQQMEDDGAARIVNWVRAADIADGSEVTVLTSRLRVLDAETLAGELVAAGFTPPGVSPVRTNGAEDMVLLRTQSHDAPGAEAHDAHV